MFFRCLRQSFCFSVLSNCKEGFVPFVRTTGSMCSCASSGMTHGWPTRSTQMTPWTLTPQCWTPFGNLTCSSPMKRGQTSTRSPRTTNCCGYSRMETFSTASGDRVWLVERKKRKRKEKATHHSGWRASFAIFKIHFHKQLLTACVALWTLHCPTCLFHSSSVHLSLYRPTPTESKFMLSHNCRRERNEVSNVAL